MKNNNYKDLGEHTPSRPTMEKNVLFSWLKHVPKHYFAYVYEREKCCKELALDKMTLIK